MNNPYATSTEYAPPAGGFGAPTGGPLYRGQEGAAQATEASVDYLRQTKPWVTFLSVMGFISTGLMVLAAAGMMLAGAFVPTQAGAPFPPALFGAFYLPLAAVYVYPSMKLWSFSGAIGRLLQSRSTADLEAALSQQKSFWKYVGILTIAMMVLYTLMFAGIMIAGLAAASASHH